MLQVLKYIVPLEFCSSVCSLYFLKLKSGSNRAEHVLTLLLDISFFLGRSLSAVNYFNYLFLGSSSVGMDISFVGFKYVYGLPEHGDSFVLRSTS